MVYDVGGSRMTKTKPVPTEERDRFCISDDDVLQLAHWACIIEDHYSLKKGDKCPMDMEWAKDGRTGELFIVQALPETVQSQICRDEIERFRLTEHISKIVTGRAIGNRIGTGRVWIIRDAHDLHEFNKGEVPVTDKTDPDWEPVMRAIRLAIRAAKQAGRKIGICGKAPSDFPEFAAFLVGQGIDSISLNPDVVLKTTQHINQIEDELCKKKTVINEHDECLKDVTHDI